MDSQQAIVAAMTAAFEALGQPARSAGAIRALIGLPLEETVRRLWPQGGAAVRSAWGRERY